MSGDTLFEKEEAAIATAQSFVEQNPDLGDHATGKALLSLLKDYQRLYKISRRLMRLSDRNERELARLAEAQKCAAEEITTKNAALETLSRKLAKYLSPQVYSSIFEGRQEVQLASQRKKLTIFFSDIEGFTELTDKLESEDVTQLINHYLTEMSRIALEHGATIDKFIGDAVMIFFGDPETKGVKEDALACTRMALAMLQQLRELNAGWQNLGIQEPLACRIGIHTGYCTVGNFGSDDRMDYTILGGAVNLASRLEAQTEAGSILISYETFALIKDDIACEPRGQIKVKGIAYPIQTYKVIGAIEDIAHNIVTDAQPIHAELGHLKIDADVQAMSTDERSAAAAMLRSLAEQIDTKAQRRD